MEAKTSIVPGPELTSGCEALAAALEGADELRGAVAFVTRSGAEVLLELLETCPQIKAELTARGAPVSDPAALGLLEERGVEVSLVVGVKASSFHPKLWLAASEGGLAVLSGSGNLTQGGMKSNREQFELRWIPSAQEAAIAAQRERLDALSDGAVRLPELRGTGFWSVWEALTDGAQEDLGRREEAEFKLAGAWADIATELLYEDLKANWEVQSKIWIIDPKTGEPKRLSGTRLKAGIDVARRKRALVPYVRAVVEKKTSGFSDLAIARRPDLMVESVVLDVSKHYRFLFSASIKEAAKRNLDAYEESLRVEDDGAM